MSRFIERQDRRLRLIAYDTPSNRRRRKLARLLEGHGTRVQKSVFEAWLTETELAWLVRKIERLIDEEEDQLFVAGLCVRCRNDMIRFGRYDGGELPQYFIA